MNTINIPISKPCLPELAEILLANQNKHADLSEVIVVLTGGRAQRRLLELLAEKAGSKELFLSPPRLMTPKSFCHAFNDNTLKHTLANSVEQTIAWSVAAYKKSECLDSILMRNASSNDTRDWFRIAQMLAPLHNTLSGEGVSMADVARHPSISGFEEEHSRWLSLAEIQKQYYNELSANGRKDFYDALTKDIQAVRESSLTPFNKVKNIYVVGVIDTFELFRRVLEVVKDKLTIVTHGCNDWFDNYGFLDMENSALESELIDFPG
ncbi:MAG: hypothetical protein KAS17_03980, partial [Victivallaceae bacterium]|nr:hypothetical protein [Victivallaceae bacterium]